MTERSWKEKIEELKQTAQDSFDGWTWCTPKNKESNWERYQQDRKRLYQVRQEFGKWRKQQQDNKKKAKEITDKMDASKNEDVKMTFKDLLEEVLNEELLIEAKVSDLLKKDAKSLTKSEINQLAKFKYNIMNRESDTRPGYAKGEEAQKEHYKKYKEIANAIEQKLRAAGHDSGVVASSRGYYR